MDSEIKKTLTGNTTAKLDNEKDLSSNRPSSYTATISGVTTVYNLFPGTVVFLGYYQGSGSVYVEVSNHELIRYLNLNDIQVWKGSELEKGDVIGTVKSRVGLQVEYCTQWKGESPYPVRFNNRLFYKQNPIDILNGLYFPYKEITVKNGIVRPNDKITFTQDELKEWGKPVQGDSTVYIEGATL